MIINYYLFIIILQIVGLTILYIIILYIILYLYIIIGLKMSFQDNHSRHGDYHSHRWLYHARFRLLFTHSLITSAVSWTGHSACLEQPLGSAGYGFQGTTLIVSCYLICDHLSDHHRASLTVTADIPGECIGLYIRAWAARGVTVIVNCSCYVISQTY